MAQWHGLDVQTGRLTTSGVQLFTFRELTGGTSPVVNTSAVVALQCVNPDFNECLVDGLSIRSAVDVGAAVAVVMPSTSAGPTAVDVENVQMHKILRDSGSLYTGAVTTSAVVRFNAAEAAAKASATSIRLRNGRVSCGGKAVGYNGLGSATAITQLTIEAANVFNVETQTSAVRTFAPTGGSVITRTAFGAPVIEANQGFWSLLPSGTLPDFAAIVAGTEFAIDVPGGGVPGGWGSPPPVGAGTTLLIKASNSWGGPGLCVIHAQENGGGAGKEWSTYAAAAAGWNVR